MCLEQEIHSPPTPFAPHRCRGPAIRTATNRPTDGVNAVTDQARVFAARLAPHRPRWRRTLSVAVMCLPLLTTWLLTRDFARGDALESGRTTFPRSPTCRAPCP